MLKIPLYAIALSVVIHALWGGNPVAGKIALEVVPPFWSAFIRFVFGIATILLWCWFRGYRVLPTTAEWKPLTIISLLFTVQIGLMNLGFEQTSGVNSSILISTNPLFAAVFAHFLISSDRLDWWRSLGLLLGFGGVVLTILATREESQGLSSGMSFGSTGDWYCLASASLLGFRLIASAKAMQSVNPFRLAMWQMVLSLPLFALAGGIFETVNWSEVSARHVAGLAYQGVVVAGIGFMGSLWMISRFQPSIIVSFNFIAPVTGVMLSAWLLGETLTELAILGAACLAIGMIIVCTAVKPDRQKRTR